MTIRRRAAGALAVVAATALGPGVPAHAHGSPTTPISRTAACAAGGGSTGTAACRAARKANGGDLGSFDNLRIAGVNGRDRAVVPDGELCSGGLDDFRGLDLPRDDFPATRVTAGGTLTVRYRATIPHAGEFRIFLTRAGYDPGKRLRWADLGSEPLVRVTDPPLTDGTYRMKVELPAGRTGRHLLYVVWETSSTPDTYYSCSDLVFPASAAPVAEPTATRTKAPRPAAAKARPVATTPTARTAAATTPPADEPRAITPVSNPKEGDTVTLGHWIIGAALSLGLGAAAWAGIGGLLRRRRESR